MCVCRVSINWIMIIYIIVSKDFISFHKENAFIRGLRRSHPISQPTRAPRDPGSNTDAALLKYL